MYIIVLGFVLFFLAGSAAAVVKTHKFIKEMETFWEEGFGVPLPEGGFIKRKWSWYVMSVAFSWVFYGLLGVYNDRDKE